MKDEVLMDFIQKSERAFGTIIQSQADLKEHLQSVAAGQRQLRTDFDDHKVDLSAHGAGATDKHRSVWIAIAALALSAVATVREWFK